MDTDGSGYHLTSAKAGVLFSWFHSYSNFPPLHVAWTEKGSTNGWLAMDVNGNGVIDNATELFSNTSTHTPKPWKSDQINPYVEPPPGVDDQNGFNSLSQLDSNLDGVIDNRDTDWPKLLVWIDTNHDGISQPSELHHLDELGIHSIDLHYKKSDKVDQYGNRFALEGTINGGVNEDGIHREIYDVFLKGQAEFEPSNPATDICWDQANKKPVLCKILLKDRGYPQ